MLLKSIVGVKAVVKCLAYALINAMAILTQSFNRIGTGMP